MGSLAQYGESALLLRIKELCSGGQPGVIVGVGDDAAVLEAIGPVGVISSDMLVENQDFSMNWATGKDIGHKAAAVNLSDMAAMGARPRALVLCIAAAADVEAKCVLDIVRGVRDVGRKYNAPLVGGDLSQTEGPLTVSVTVMGQASKSKLLRRHRGQPGDRIAVTGALGKAAAGLHCLLLDKPVSKSLRNAQLRPQPKLREGQLLAGWGRVGGCADISDGLIRDALHTVVPGAGVNLWSNSIPISRSVRQLAKEYHVSPLKWALGGGEDFELVFSFRKAQYGKLMKLAQDNDLAISVVGEVIDSGGISLDGHELEDDVRGFEHFCR